jgi:tetratricopeptide (TPR) repeat protein
VKSLFKIFLAIFFAAGFCWASYDSQSAREMLAGGQMNQAIQYLQQRTKQVPNDAEAYHLLSRAYYEMEQWDASISAAQKAVALNPNSSEYHLWLGRAYGNKAEHSSWFTALTLARKTRTEFETAVRLDNTNADARSDLAEYYMEAPGFLGGGKDKARAQAEQLAAYNAAGSHWVIARLAEKDDNNAEAEQEYKKAIDASSDPGGEWLNLASFYRRQKRFADMEAAINHAVTFGQKKSNVLFGAAEVLYHAGRNFPGAAQFIRAYINSYKKPAASEDPPPTFQAHYLLGQILEKQGDKPAAAAEYRAALEMASDYRQARDALNRVTRH